METDKLQEKTSGIISKLQIKSLGEVTHGVTSKIQNISSEDIIRTAIKVPGVKIDRTSFLRKELSSYYSKDVVEKAIECNPACAGIPVEAIDRFAKEVINYETNKVTAISAVAGIPGGFAMAATIPADLAQYFGFMLRVTQKLAYLYGFDEFELSEDEINDNTLNELLIFLGAMFGVQEANAGIRILAQTTAQNISKKLAQKALTKGAVYPVVKKVAKTVGVKMTKQIFANTVSKAVPLVGGIISGGLTYATFKPCSNRLKNSFKKLPLCKLETYIEENV